MATACSIHKHKSVANAAKKSVEKAIESVQKEESVILKLVKKNDNCMNNNVDSIEGALYENQSGLLIEYDSEHEEPNESETTIIPSNEQILNSTAISEVNSNENQSSISSEVSNIDASEIEEANNRGTLCDLTLRNVMGIRLRSDPPIDSAMLAICEPQSFHDAMKTPEKNQWFNAMQEEYASLIKNNT